MNRRPQPKEFPFRVPFEVRDYECDMEGIVNNAVYQNYLEHARHVYLRSRGVDFGELTRSGIHLVVIRVELDYLAPLRGGDSFWVGVQAYRRTTMRGIFHQAIFRLPEETPVLRAVVHGTSLNTAGRPTYCDALTLIFPEDEANEPNHP